MARLVSRMIGLIPFAVRAQRLDLLIALAGADGQSGRLHAARAAYA
jgi:hypothetical protein